MFWVLDDKELPIVDGGEEYELITSEFNEVLRVEEISGAE